MDEVNKYINQCRVILLVMSPAFIQDGWCRDVAIRDTTLRPHAVIPLVYKHLELEDDDLTFKNVLESCRPIDWSDDLHEQEIAFEKLMERITGDGNLEIMQEIL